MSYFRYQRKSAPIARNTYSRASCFRIVDAGLETSNNLMVLVRVFFFFAAGHIQLYRFHAPSSVSCEEFGREGYFMV